MKRPGGNQCLGPLWSVAWCTKGDTFPGDMRGATLSLCLAGIWSRHEKHPVGFLVKLLDELIDRPKLHDAGEAVVHASRQFSSCRALCAEVAQRSRGRDFSSSPSSRQFPKAPHQARGCPIFRCRTRALACRRSRRTGIRCRTRSQSEVRFSYLGAPYFAIFSTLQIRHLNGAPKPSLPTFLCGTSSLILERHTPNRCGSSPSSSGNQKPC